MIDDSSDLFVLSRTCPSGKSGGSLGEFGPGQMVKEFNDVVFTTGKVGKVRRSRIRGSDPRLFPPRALSCSRVCVLERRCNKP